jgi:separase
MATKRPANSARKPQKTAVSTDQLADQLATGLTISNLKGKQKASDEDLRLSAMRSVNSASQALSTAVQSGWKRSSGTTQSKPSSTLSNVTASAASASKHLAILRSMRPNDIDVERAATSVLSKLVALELVSIGFKILGLFSLDDSFFFSLRMR